MHAGVSLCMIVRDEEANLPHCLDGVLPLVDEVRIADTGSTDRTVDVARDLGALVTSFPWRDDFAAARNASMEGATQPWIFWLDADDRLDAENCAKLATLFSSLSD